MSFFDNVGKMASEALGAAQPQDVAAAATDHISQMDESELAGHLHQSVGTMDQTSLMALGQHLLQTFASRGGDAAQAAQEAGTSQDAVAGGSPNAVASLVDYAKNNPGILQTAATAFAQRNPEALQQMAPGLIKGIMARISGSQAT